jgi:hypothetical protein
MLLTKTFEPPSLAVIALGGVVTPTDQADFVGWVRETARSAGAVRLLVLLELFGGWHPPGSFDDAAFWLQDDEDVSKIAIVGAAAWRHAVLTVIGQPLRRIPIDYFETEAAARRWLATEAETATKALPT